MKLEHKPERDVHPHFVGVGGGKLEKGSLRKKKVNLLKKCNDPIS